MISNSKPSAFLFRKGLQMIASISLILTIWLQADAQHIPTPAEIIGFNPGEDYKLADNDQLEAYYRAIAEVSDRIKLREIGTTTEGRTMLLLYISSEENLAQLDRWRSISKQLAMARDLDDEQARQLANEGKAITWIDSGLHSTEVAHAQHAPHLAYHMITDESDETRRIREDVILLLMPVMNPDGQDIVVDWYRSNVGTEYETAPLPWLYHKYVGHDNNRDWYMLLQEESKNVAQILWHEWYPQIVYNHHQTGPFPGRIFVPPFTDPVNPHIPAQVVRGVNAIGSFMADRFAREDKPGVTSRVTYSMWWNGGMRLAPYYHNQMGILTETQLHRYATPKYFSADDFPEYFQARGLQLATKRPGIFYHEPWMGGWWRIGDAVEYMMTGSLAVLDISSRMKDQWLYGKYQMGKRQIEAGKEQGPFAYVIPPDQWDRHEAVEMMRSLRRGGVEIHKARTEFSAGGKVYPAGSYIAYAGQPYRAHLMDLMEPQDYPDMRQYPGGPVEPPYDMAGWTLPIQMHVRVDRIENAFEVTADRVEQIAAPDQQISGSGEYGYLLSPASNFYSKAVNRLLKEGIEVRRSLESFDHEGSSYEAGTLVIVSSGRNADEAVQQINRDLGMAFTRVNSEPASQTLRIHEPNIGIYKSWVSNIPEGWTRWVLDEYEFARVHTLDNEQIRNGDLTPYDIILIPPQNPSSIFKGHEPGTMPEPYTGGIGAKGVAALESFVQNGGTLLGWDGGSEFIMEYMDLPVRNRLAGIGEEDFFIPGSLLSLKPETGHFLSNGMPEETAAFYVIRRGSHSHVFDIIKPAKEEGRTGPAPKVEVLARYGENDILLSGWARNADAHLGGHPAAVRVEKGEGQVVLLGFRAQFRGQPRATFKYLFNTIYASSTEDLPRVEPYRITTKMEE